MIVNIEKADVIVTGLYQYDYGQSMEFSGCQVVDGTEVHFFQGEYGCRTEVKENRTEIPDYLLSNSKTILVYLYVVNDTSGETIKKITMLILPREKPPDYVDPAVPADYSRLLPLGGDIGDFLVKTEDGYAWKNFDDSFCTDEELRKVSERIPVAMTVDEILSICKA